MRGGREGSITAWLSLRVSPRSIVSPLVLRSQWKRLAAPLHCEPLLAAACESGVEARGGGCLCCSGCCVALRSVFP